MNTLNAGLAIVGGQVLEFIDDGGGTIRIEITNLAAGVQGGFVTVLPVDGSESVAVARIDADLTGGRALVLTSVADREQVIAAVRLGASGVLSKNASVARGG